jgi:hypothetical protein
MIHALQRHFRQIYSIELSDRLYRFARRRFSNLEHVELIHGDSAEQLRRVVQKLQQPALFWLDGHYSGGVTALGATQTPVWDELHCVYGGSDLDHVTILDNDRLFGTEADYPTMEAVRELILRYRPDYTIEKKCDMIRVGPKSDSRKAADQFSKFPSRLRMTLPNCVIYELTQTLHTDVQLSAAANSGNPDKATVEQPANTVLAFTASSSNFVREPSPARDL